MNELLELGLFEVSITPNPERPATHILSMESLDREPLELLSVGGDDDLMQEHRAERESEHKSLAPLRVASFSVG